MINEFVKEASKFVRGSFSISLYPDPCFAKERFGLDVHSLAKYVDFFIVPIYDLAYSTTYWVEDLAYSFCKQLKKPFYVELYAGYPKPTIENLLGALAIASDYADGVILAAYDLHLIKEIQEKLVKEDKLHRYLKEHEHESVLSIIERWKGPLLKEV